MFVPIVDAAKEEIERTVQSLQVENIGEETLESCVATAEIDDEAKGILPAFSLVWPLSRPTPTVRPSGSSGTALAWMNAKDDADLMPHVPRTALLMFATRKKETGQITLAFRFEEEYYVPIEGIKPMGYLDLNVRFAGKKYQHPVVYKFRLDLTAQWEKFGFMQVTPTRTVLPNTLQV